MSHPNTLDKRTARDTTILLIQSSNFDLKINPLRAEISRFTGCRRISSSIGTIGYPEPKSRTAHIFLAAEKYLLGNETCKQDTSDHNCSCVHRRPPVV
jgi:hypothetical protein